MMVDGFRWDGWLFWSVLQVPSCHIMLLLVQSDEGGGGPHL